VAHLKFQNYLLACVICECEIPGISAQLRDDDDDDDDDNDDDQHHRITVNVITVVAILASLSLLLS